MSDYAEPFAVSGGIFVNDSACRQIASLDHGPGSRLYREKLAARIVACVNGCEGINPEAVPELLAVCKALRAAYTNHGTCSAGWAKDIAKTSGRARVAIEWAEGDKT